MTASSLEIAALMRRIADLEAHPRIRACLNRYMALCDDLGEGSDLDMLMDLFTADAVWEGAGGHARVFGRLEGRQAIRAMFAKYTVAPAHFRLNVHFLTTEEIQIESDRALGSWILLQTSTFANDRSQLSAARLSVRFVCQDGCWRMAHFITKRLFSRGVAAAWDEAADMPTPR